MYSRRELPTRWTRHLCRSNNPLLFSPPNITMACTRSHHAQLLNRSRVRCPTPISPSVIPLPPPKHLPRAPANHQNSWPLLVAVVSHQPQTPIKTMFHMGLLRPASVRSRPLPTASRASPVLSIQSLEALTGIRQTSIRIRDASHSELPVFPPCITDC